MANWEKLNKEFDFNEMIEIYSKNYCFYYKKFFEIYNKKS